MKRCYYVEEKDACMGYAVVAEKPSQAKSFVYGAGDIDCDWTELRVHLCYNDNKNPIVPPDGISIGHIFEAIEGLELGVYTYSEYVDCPVCEQDTIIRRQDDGSVMCDNCWKVKQEKAT